MMKEISIRVISGVITIIVIIILFWMIEKLFNWKKGGCGCGCGGSCGGKKEVDKPAAPAPAVESPASSGAGPLNYGVMF